MEKSKFQWSIKLENGEIYVVTADNSTELQLAIDEIRTKFLNNSRIIPEPITNQPSIPTTTASPKPTSPSVVCPICGAKAYINEGTSKTGRPYKIQKCSKFPEISPNGHSKWLPL